jgi:hypothetical protein
VMSYPDFCVEACRKATKILGECNRCLSRDSNPTPPKYVIKVLPVLPTCSSLVSVKTVDERSASRLGCFNPPLPWREPAVAFGQEVGWRLERVWTLYNSMELSFLRSCQLCSCSYSRTSQHVMEPEVSLPCSQESPHPAPRGRYPQPDQSSPYHSILSKIHFNISHPPTPLSS